MPSHANPEAIVLDVRPGATPSERPPVRIFVGTEPSQYRAERVFLWSIDQVRDPGRVYEIHLMKSLPGFRDWLWNTGFTNYRFAVPELAGNHGRAIYNDVDQIYLEDPGQLFDLDLADHGFLAVSETDTSVMLMDCEKMSRHWTLAGSRRRRKYGLINAARSESGIYGALPPEWNARDEEHSPTRSKLLHYTTIHKQPWRPFPERFYYQPNPVADLWFEMERQAGTAGYRPSGDSPTAVPASVSAAIGQASSGELIDDAVREVCQRTGTRTVLEIVPGASGLGPADGSLWGDIECDRIGFEAAAQGVYDGVVSRVRLDMLPADAVQASVDDLFARARHFVFAAVACDEPPRRRWLRSPQGTIQ